MELTLDTRPSMIEPASGARQATGPAISPRSTIDDSVPAPAWRETGGWLACECPDDCPRDHQNE